MRSSVFNLNYFNWRPDENDGKKQPAFWWVSVADAAAATGLFPVTAAWKLFSTIIRAARRLRVVDAFVDDLERDLTPRPTQNEDLQFLSKVSRVARLMP